MGFRTPLREPLVHFLLLGAALFFIDAWLRPGSNPQGGEIVVSEARARSLAQNFQRTWQRAPTREELDGLVQDFVRDEVLYREALALGLERDDTIIRRRLRQKMEFMAEEAAAAARPTDAELAAYLAEHADRFRIEPRATFSQVSLEKNIQLLEPRYENVQQSDVARLFGAEFAGKLFELKAAPWTGKIPSGFGIHQVRVEALVPGKPATLDEARPLVEREWANEKRKELGEAFYARLRSKYKVTLK